jgi:hypothetical protein
VTVRKFEYDGNYVKTVFSPAGDLSPERLGGRGYIEYESGKGALQAPDIHRGIFRESQWLPPGLDADVFGCRPAAFISAAAV